VLSVMWRLGWCSVVSDVEVGSGGVKDVEVG
jgi:hypothetical protein